MMKKIKTGVLSYGMSGTLFHCPFLQLHEGFELCSVVERTTKKAALKYPSIKSYDTVEAMFSDEELDLIVINTPSATHFEFAIQALQSGKHVLVEKPFTATSAEAKKLYKVAKQNNCLVFPFQNRRFDSDFLAVKKIVDSEVLGDLIEAHLRYDRYNITISDNKTKESDGIASGLLYNLGPHVIDAAFDLFGIPEEWSKVSMKHRPNSKIDDYGTFHLRYKSGLQVFLTVSLLVADAQKSFVIHGKKGSFVKDRTDVQEEQLKVGMLPSDPAFGQEPNGVEGLLTTITDGVKKQEKIASPASSYMGVFDAIYKSVFDQKSYFVSESQLIKQIEILEN